MTSPARPEPPNQDDPRVCGLCRRGWGSVIVTPPPGYFSLFNSRTGKFHGELRGKTACGLIAVGEEWQRV